MSSSHAGGVTLIVMAKLPEPGRVKTRLLPAVSPEQAALLQEAFLEQVLTRAGRVDWSRRVFCYDGVNTDLPTRASATGFELLAQSSGDLGSRLVAAAKELRSAANGSLLFLGSDSPDLPRSHLLRAAQILADHDVISGPAGDGGYWCLGFTARVNVAALLRQIEWSSGRELIQTLARARSLGYNTALADRWDDIDRPHDLKNLIGRLRSSADPDDVALLQRLSFLPDEVLSP